MTAAPVLGAYLDHFAADPGVRAVKNRSLDLLAAASPATVLDLGCGAGHDLTPLASLVGPAGHVFGVDANAGMLALARTRLAPSTPVTLVRAHSHCLPFANASIAAVRCERLLLHDAQPHRTVVEMARAVVPKGRVVLTEPDWGGLALHHPDQSVTDRLLTGFTARNFATPQAGRMLPSLLRSAGLTPVLIEIQPQICDYDLIDMMVEFRDCAFWGEQQGLLSRGQSESWLSMLRSARDKGVFTCALPHFIAVGIKPS
ncbi:methyltransferase domain-containing protein [Streptomyces sp. NRRL B-1347]|uniref:methyltransferase domain-containing protein n=1 Tax=Streptomyces sp. NRRL B-1347 TaxID=1476877 RepID=UPI001F38DD8B|nr:methyltransferase domain-containing protein [Streptomyces sp. NRRL B-1347]